MSAQNQRLRRAKRSRSKMAELHVTRLTVFRSNTNIYAQIIDGNDNKIIATASTLESEVKKKLKSRSNVDAAVEVGKRIAEKAVKAGVKIVAFDRSGYKYHGRIKALADAARENGLTF
jgi:large subunit ribosomal protein L18